MSQISPLLAHRAWLRRPSPFPHVIARNVLVPAFYTALERQVGGILDRGLSDTAARETFSRSIPGYDAYGIGFDASVTGPLSLFLSLEWRDLLSGLFEIGRTPYVFAGAHHHAVGSKSGFIHNDLNPVWFPRANEDTIQTPRNDLCAYRTGAGALAPADKIEVIRGAAMIFFLLNDGWSPGDGGETGLYSSARAKVSQPDARVTPDNNCLIAFECTPRSFHSFITNTRLPRTSIIMWVHRPIDEAIAKFGHDKIERWAT